MPRRRSAPGSRSSHSRGRANRARVSAYSAGMRLAPVVLCSGVAPVAADPKIPQEVTDLARVVNGTWKCTGTATIAPDPEAPLVATLVTKSDLDGFWIHSTLDGK